MKKFLAVFDGFNMSKSTLGYGIQLARIADAQLVGVFLDESIYRSYDVLKVMKLHKDYDKVIKQLDEKDKQKRDDAARKFQKACSKASIRYSIHRDTGIAILDLKKESMFADLVIINEHETFSRHRQKSPTRFIKELLADVQCPVMVVPNGYKEIDKVVLLYDGGPSSLYAIKMFSYLLGKDLNLPVEVLTVKESYMASTRLPENKLMREFIKRHFPNAEFKVVRGEAEVQILSYLRDHGENELVVLGAYRRSEFSRWFKTSMADVLMRELDTPLFIAHN